jgi:hypothetical protein
MFYDPWLVNYDGFYADGASGYYPFGGYYNPRYYRDFRYRRGYPRQMFRRRRFW